MSYFENIEKYSNDLSTQRDNFAAIAGRTKERMSAENREKFEAITQQFEMIGGAVSAAGMGGHAFAKSIGGMGDIGTMDEQLAKFKAKALYENPEFSEFLENPADSLAQKFGGGGYGSGGNAKDIQMGGLDMGEGGFDETPWKSAKDGNPGFQFDEPHVAGGKIESEVVDNRPSQGAQRITDNFQRSSLPKKDGGFDHLTSKEFNDATGGADSRIPKLNLAYDGLEDFDPAEGDADSLGKSVDSQVLKDRAVGIEARAAQYQQDLIDGVEPGSRKPTGVFGNGVRRQGKSMGDVMADADDVLEQRAQDARRAEAEAKGGLRGGARGKGTGGRVGGTKVSQRRASYAGAEREGGVSTLEEGGMDVVKDGAGNYRNVPTQEEFNRQLENMQEGKPTGPARIQTNKYGEELVGPADERSAGGKGVKSADMAPSNRAPIYENEDVLPRKTQMVRRDLRGTMSREEVQAQVARNPELDGDGAHLYDKPTKGLTLDATEAETPSVLSRETEAQRIGRTLKRTPDPRIDTGRKTPPLPEAGEAPDVIPEPGKLAGQAEGEGETLGTTFGKKKGGGGSQAKAFSVEPNRVPEPARDVGGEIDHPQKSVSFAEQIDDGGLGGGEAPKFKGASFDDRIADIFAQSGDIAEREGTDVDDILEARGDPTRDGDRGKGDLSDSNNYTKEGDSPTKTGKYDGEETLEDLRSRNRANGLHPETNRPLFEADGSPMLHTDGTPAVKGKNKILSFDLNADAEAHKKEFGELPEWAKPDPNAPKAPLAYLEDKNDIRSPLHPDYDPRGAKTNVPGAQGSSDPGITPSQGAQPDDAISGARPDQSTKNPAGAPKASGGVDKWGGRTGATEPFQTSAPAPAAKAEGAFENAGGLLKEGEGVLQSGESTLLGDSRMAAQSKNTIGAFVEGLGAEEGAVSAGTMAVEAGGAMEMASGAGEMIGAGLLVAGVLHDVLEKPAETASNIAATGKIGFDPNAIGGSMTGGGSGIA